MPVRAKKPAAKSKAKSKKSSSKKKISLIQLVSTPWRKFRTRQKKFLSRRPHRSFRLTRRRDYKRNLRLPGYWSFTNEVRKLLWQNKWLFTKFLLLYSFFSAVVLGIMSQDSFQLLNDAVKTINQDIFNGKINGLLQNAAIFGGVLSGAFTAQPTEAQQVYGSLLLIIGWMSAIWLYRQILAGNKDLKLRDGLYSSGSPLVATTLIFLVVLIQLIPLGLALIAYGAAIAVDVFDDTLFTTLFWLIEVILIVMTFYWLTSSLIAMVIVTLPGMYPFAAFKAAGDLVVGRRLRIVYRMVWLLLSIIIMWAILLIPSITLANIINLAWLPIVPIVVLLLGTFTLLWFSAYIYLLYRKLVSDGTAPA